MVLPAQIPVVFVGIHGLVSSCRLALSSRQPGKHLPLVLARLPMRRVAHRNTYHTMQANWKGFTIPVLSFGRLAFKMACLRGLFLDFVQIPQSISVKLETAVTWWNLNA